MAYTVRESVQPFARPNEGAVRQYVVEWTLEDGDDPLDNHEDFARSAVFFYLQSWVQDVTTRRVRRLEVDEDEVPTEQPLANEARLSSFLHGYPIQTIEVDGVEANDNYYEATVNWGRPNDGALIRQVAGSNLGQANSNDDPKTIVTHDVQAGIRGRTIDYAPLEYFFSSRIGWEYLRDVKDLNGRRVRRFLEESIPEEVGDPFVAGADSSLVVQFDPQAWVQEGNNRLAGGAWKPESPPYDDIAGLNYAQPEADGPVVLRGLSYSGPSPNITVTHEVSGGAPATSWVSKLQDAANRGVINDAPFTIANQLYAAYTLLLTDFSARTTTGGSTTLQFGFRYEPQKTIPYRAVSYPVDTAVPAHNVSPMSYYSCDMGNFLYTYDVAKSLDPTYDGTTAANNEFWLAYHRPTPRNYDNVFDGAFHPVSLPNDTLNPENNFLAVCGHDYPHRFIANTVVGNDAAGEVIVKSETKFFAVSRLFERTSFRELLGVNLGTDVAPNWQYVDQL